MSSENEDQIKSEPVSTDLSIGFLGDLTDGRLKGNWKSRYEAEALSHIKWEQKYLLLLLFTCLFVPLVLGVISNEWLATSPAKYQNLKKYLFGLFGGTLGGTLFSMKWLVHSVAKDTWNYDRQLWR